MVDLERQCALIECFCKCAKQIDSQWAFAFKHNIGIRPRLGIAACPAAKHMDHNRTRQMLAQHAAHFDKLAFAHPARAELRDVRRLLQNGNQPTSSERRGRP